MDYNQTVHLPQTDFPMRAGLPKREPEMLQEMYDHDLYHKMVKRNEGKPTFVLHDGPPYANGNIHIGTALNKILKDMIVKHRNMTGWCAPYVPGWDTHGLPIESAVLKDKKVKRDEMTTAQFRTKCREYAESYIEKMTGQFQRLGVLGEWENPYITLLPEFEAKQIEVFGKMAEKGLIYKGMKPVYWCPFDQTALAEAEIEYADDPCTTIFVKFPVADDKGKLGQYADLSRTYFVIWTTTPWTIPGNYAICLNAEFDYVLLQVPSGDVYVLAQDLAESVCKAAGIDYAACTVLATLKGSAFELMRAKHPLFDRESVILNGEHVTLDAGSGCVHTAPGFGAEDFQICQQYDKAGLTHIGVPVPVNAKGVMTDERYNGQFYAKGNDMVVADLEAEGFLVAKENITHSYPHCWRCKHPIIYRATEQWFCSVDAIKDAAVKACDSIQWKPEWGKERMTSMITERNDWCISRQRVWGVPIPVFYCKKCGKYHITDASIKAVSDLFRKEGSDAWYKYDANDILPKTEVCECGASDWEKDPDIMDVWFDSGSTWSAVCRERPELRWPVDMYMEGADQFRGWFQSSLLTSVATQGVAPYREVLCHGWVVDAQGKQMHKSAGNGMEPSEIIRDYGADIIRLWVASSDYTVDVRAGKEIFRQLSEAYRKMRNTARFMLGNISDFDPAKDMVDDDQLFEIDRWALEACNKLTATMRDAYEHYDFSRAYHALYNFCVIDMSNFYMDVIKDRLYCADDHARRCAQTALYRILVDFTKLLAPILCFTSQEIWSYIPKLDGMKDYVVFEQMPEAKAAADEAFEAKWDRIMAIRDDVKKVLEQARADKVIGSALEAGLTLYCSKEVYDFLNAIPMDELADLFIVSHVDLVEGEGGVKGLVEGLGVSAAHAAGNKCLRCWKYETTVGEDGLCPRCAKVLKQ